MSTVRRRAARPAGRQLVIEGLMPAGVAWAEAFDDTLARPADPRELALVRGRPERIVRQFTAARACARRCLDALGAPPGPLPRTAQGAPAWPAGFVGSITHCAGFRGAVAARSEAWAALGVDAEPALPLPRGVLGLVSSPSERRMVARLAGTRPQLPWDRLLFSAKEAVYKAWHPATRRWIGTAAIEIRLTTGGLLTAVVRPDRTPPPRRRPGDERASGPGTEAGPDGVAARYTGRWHADAGLLLTGVAVPAGDHTAPHAGRRVSA